jgi:uncharacterized membrane protein
MEHGAPEATGEGTSRIVNLLTATLTTLTIIGIIVQLYSYIAVHSFLIVYFVDPDEIDITPLNASFRLKNTAIWIALLAMFVFMMAAWAGRLLRSIGRKFIIPRVNKPLEDPASRLTRMVGRIPDPPPVSRLSLWLRFPVAILVVGIIMGQYISDQAKEAGRMAKSDNYHPGFGISTPISLDLWPRYVMLEWREQRTFLRC